MRGSGERLHGMQEVSGSIPLFSTKKALYFAGSMVLFFLLKPILGLHCFACMSFGLFAENRDVPADKRVPITKETAVQQVK